MDEMVILVDWHDQQIGVEEKLKAHREGKLHRAFSVFIFNKKGEMLMQRRAHEKYHSGGLWTNACCSHPRPHETVEHAAARRLREEMGFTCALQKKFHFIYKAGFDHGLIEHEFDHVFIGSFDGKIHPDPTEVADYRWASIEAIREDLKICPDNYTVWFKIAIDRTVETFRA
jgi:isopentenyl-diphosphate delta-isomerase